MYTYGQLCKVWVKCTNSRGGPCKFLVFRMTGMTGPGKIVFGLTGLNGGKFRFLTDWNGMEQVAFVLTGLRKVGFGMTKMQLTDWNVMD
jgi:hypothetical protein